MKADDIKTITVIGGGTMGNGIAHHFAQMGYAVNLVDTEKQFLDRALVTISKNMDRQVKKEVLTEEAKKAALARIVPTTDLSIVKGSQLIIEAIYEDALIKQELFKKLDALCSAETILASNTSSLPITQIAAATKRPDRVIGMHFMNPVPMMKLVEVIRGIATSDETFDIIKELSEKTGKVPVEVQDNPGFVGNRILMPMINEAAYVLMEGIASAEGIDTVMKLGMGHPMGPLTLADFIGLDVCLAILEVMHDGLGDPKYHPCPLLRKMVQAGYLGRKSGQGFYKYA